MDLGHVMVTGGAGFIGSHLVDALLEKGFDVKIIDNFSTGSEENIRQFAFHERVQVIKADLQDYDAIKQCFKDVDTVFHLAAVVGVKLATANPLRVLNHNISGIKNVLKASVDGGVAKVIFASSSEVYGDTDVVPMDEGIPLQPISPYGVSKIVGETYCKAYLKEYGLKSLIVRYFNVYGPRQCFKQRSWVMPTFSVNALEGKPLPIHGSGLQTRDFTYISDAVEGTVLVALKGNATCDVYNIGTGTETSIIDLAREIIKMSRSESRIVFTKPRSFEIRRRCADLSKISRLGYNPKVSLNKGLKNTLTSFRDYLNVEGISDTINISKGIHA